MGISWGWGAVAVYLFVGFCLGVLVVTDKEDESAVAAVAAALVVTFLWPFFMIIAIRDRW